MNEGSGASAGFQPPSEAAAGRIDRLLDAIELIKADRRPEAVALLRDLIREDANFTDAWLWMSVAVDSPDQASICLDNVLRVNPNHQAAAGALYTLRTPAIEMERRRSTLRMLRDMSVTLLWIIIIGVLMTSTCMLTNAFYLSQFASAP